MRADYKRDLKHNYLILQNEQEVDTSSYQVRMLIGNSIPTLLPCQLEGMDGNMMFYYETTALESLSVYFEHQKIGMDDLEALLMNLVEVLETIGDYLLDPNQLVVTPEYMYLQLETKKLYLCYLPGYSQDIRRQFQGFTEYLLPKIDHEDSEAVMLGYGIYRQSREEGFHIEQMKEEIYQAKRETPEDRKTEKFASFAYEEPEEIPQESESIRKKAMDEFYRNVEEDSNPDVKENQILMGILGVVGGLLILFTMFLLRSMGFLSWMTAPVLIAMLFLTAVLTGIGWSFYQKKKRMENSCKPEGHAL